jgi:ribonuclease R
LGAPDAAGAISLISIAAFDIPNEFPPAALAEAAAAPPASAAGRVDLRDLALVTIDGSDARDFDDAVWAEPDPDPANPGGWHLAVAIADVAFYVAPGSALDREASLRGNSVYFPDRVVPMLPETLSNGLCSLKPGEDRACLAVHLWIGADGRKRRHRFERAIMRSAARLTYEEVQAARNGVASALAKQRLDALYGAFAALDGARKARGALALDLIEYSVVLDAANVPVAITPRQRLDSHRLIEEFMVLANVAAAEELETKRRPCVYRIHDAPNPERLDSLRLMLDEIGVPGLTLAKGQALRPELFNRVLNRAVGLPEAPMINDLVLRAQAQAVYSTNNIGHFGLALPRYAHFTSPIRRYADLLVHRALLGETNPPASELAEIADHVSATERRAVAAERAALDRYRARFCSGMVGGLFAARISGVARFGFFVTLADSGADGLVPIGSLPPDFYRHDAKRMRLTGRHSRRHFAIGDAVAVRLVQADAIGGRLLFRLEDDDAPPSRPPPRHRQARPHRRR